MIKYLLSFVFLVLLVSPVQANAAPVECNRHPIFCQIVKNKPSIDRNFAMHLSNVIHHVSRKYNIPSNIYTGILAQESMYRLKAVNCHKGLIDGQMDTIVKVCTDFGMSQIWYKTAKGFNFDITKLTTDLYYSVEAGAIVMADFKKRYSHREINWWTRYNSSTPFKREIYRQLVSRYI